MNAQALYAEAARLHSQAKSLMDAWEGKEAPQEITTQIDTLLDEAEAKTLAAQRSEKQAARVAQIAGQLDQPANQLPAPTGNPKAPDQGDIATKAFTKALRQGTRALSDAEFKALQADVDAAGGYLVAPVSFVQGLLKFVDDQVYIRQAATVHRLVKAESLGIMSLDSDLSDAEWTSELSSGTADSVNPFGSRALSPHPLAKSIKVSRTLINRSMQPVEQIVQQRLAYKFAVTEEKGFLTGTGANQPLGMFTASPAGISTSRDVTASSTTAFTADDLMDLFYSLKSQYQARATLLAHRDFIKRCRKLKDGNGQYIWVPGLGGQPNTILDRPYVQSEYAPNTFTTGQYVAVIGDMSFYHIAEALEMQVQVLNELYAATNQVGYIGRMEVDGLPVLEEAFARLKLG